MIRIAVLGDIGSGKSHVAGLFGYPVFNADIEVAKLYRESRKCYEKLKKALPNYIKTFPIKKSKLSKAVLDNPKNLVKIAKIVHPEVRTSLNNFIKKNQNKRFVVLDIPLLLENQRYKNNLKIVKKFKKFQLPIELKKKKSDFIVKNNFRNNKVKKNVKKILEKIILNA